MSIFRFKSVVSIEATSYAEAIIKVYDSIETFADNAVLLDINEEL